MSVTLSYTLIGAGWAVCIVDADGCVMRMQVSYLSDAFDDLVRATLSALVNRRNEAVLFIDEPGTYRWHLAPAGERLCVRIVAYEAMFIREGDSSGRVCFEAECRLRTFAGAVLSAGQHLLAAHGEAGYAREWRHRFPAEPLTRLRQALRRA